MAKIPDEIIFGIDNNRNAVDYGFVRNIKDDNELINLLRLRLMRFFIEQVQVLQDSKSAFPLTTMTCIGIETLGEIFIEKNANDTSFQFVEIIKKVNQTFGFKPNKKYMTKLKEIWSEKDLAKIDNFGKLTYRFFRNTMVHGYQGKGVFLSYEDTESIEIDEKSAFIKINPDWFWNSFKGYYERQFKIVEKAESNNKERRNCIDYIKNFLLG